MDATKQVFRLTEENLSHLVGQEAYPDAAVALDRFRKIRSNGGTPRCFHSQRHGFSVLDAENPSQWEKIMTLESSSEPFPT